MARISLVDLCERSAAVVVVGAVGLSCLLIGGIHASSHGILFAIALFAAVVDVAARVRRGRPLRMPVLAWPIVVGAVLTTFSLAPLPVALRALLSPDSVDRLEQLRPLLADDAAVMLRPVLALDPPEAALALVRLLFALVVVVVVADRARHRVGRALLWRGLLVVAFVVGFATVFSYAIGAARFFEVFGIPVNPNHRARVLGALGLLCLGRSLTLRPRVEAAWFAVAGGLCTLLVPVTGSRGGVVALVVGALALAFLLRRTDAPGAKTRVWAGNAIVSLVVFVAIVGGALLFAGEDRLAQMTEETLAHPERLKTFLWEPSLRVAMTHPLIGVGNNGFGVAFPAVLGAGELDATLTYTHAENIVLQTLADHGLVGGFLVLLAALVVFVTVARQLRSPAELAAAPALVFLVVGDLFDFVLELPVGIGLAAVSLGLLSGRLAPHHAPRTSLRPAPAAVVVVVIAVVGGVAARAGFVGWRPQLDDEIAATPVAQRSATLTRALTLHPSDAAYATLLAIEARRRRQPLEAVRWANRALVVWPAFRDAHLEAARALAVAGRLPQAMLEYREAARARLDSALVREVAQRTADVVERRRALPQPESAGALSLFCEVLVREARTRDARSCFADVVALPDATSEHRRRALALAFDDGDLTTAQRLWATLVPAGTPPDGADAVWGARLKAAVDGDDAALTESSAWLRSARAPLPLLEWRLTRLRALERHEEAVATLERMLPLVRSPRQRQSLEMNLVELLWKQGEWARALQQLEKSIARAPRDPALLAQKALVEVELGRASEAQATLARLRLVAPGDKRIAEIEQRLWTR
jgi:O-antigen ligase/tetratricopeptide (TPR) repeat protein